ncbi:MAG: leucine-rich repeat domain-containing protein [Clostridiales bacterium]|nr:leucine-rich repeat domain-containing protein [Clostridiales bacterium]
MTRIGNGAFIYFEKLKTVEFKCTKTKITIGETAFGFCTELNKLSDLNKAKITKIEARAFIGCKKLSGTLTLPEGLTSLGKSVFLDCTKLKGLKLPKTLKKVGAYCFFNCKKLKTITLKSNIKSCGKYMFYKVNQNAKIICTKTKYTNCKFAKKAKEVGLKVKVK